MLKPFYQQFAEVMRENKYDSHQAVIRMVTSLAVFGEKEGANSRLEVNNPALFQDFKNLYRFCELAYLSKPDRLGPAFCVPRVDGDPRPFAESSF